MYVFISATLLLACTGPSLGQTLTCNGVTCYNTATPGIVYLDLPVQSNIYTFVFKAGYRMDYKSTALALLYNIDSTSLCALYCTQYTTCTAFLTYSASQICILYNTTLANRLPTGVAYFLKTA